MINFPDNLQQASSSVGQQDSIVPLTDSVVTGSMHPIVIIATMKPREFEDYFAAMLNESVFVFNAGQAALQCWRQSASATVFADCTGLTDRETGFRLAKSIHTEEAAGNTG